ncbi:sugar transferase [Shewanella amazonensis]|uniref:Capsular polysaccharide synthesis protein n=1 Tax=Shewanella amazonensis (strain ATCC BAA-1098 / SB2B) TaxID=326297 RepID=A1S7U6_SHEAM|nr:sugar transferase [Shewanella amazonensis]ABM00453.1 capsular polysaccharide synthesis protein [Shewanella amazonensis SB2B]
MYSKIIKRIFDLFIVLFATVFLFPLLIAVCFLIKVFDPGPIIFKQKRIGRNAKEFDFYKFRSMPVNTGDIPSDKLGSIDITWVGRLIRRTNLDELPQLFNVLKGDMSIVGPRPPIVSQRQLVELRKQNGAIACRPGLTGLAQVSAFDGMTVEQKAAFDAEYARKVSFLTDVKIILRTFTYLLKPPPVY